MAHRPRLTDWDPEDPVAWEAGNKAIARRNLICTIAGDHAGFSIWTLWSVMALFMPPEVYGLSAGDKLLLGAVATVVGGCARIPYTLGLARFGGRTWTVFSAVVLLVPTVATLVLLAHPGLPLWPYVLCAALTGLGGGNYSASLANVNAFYPQRLKGVALGVNAGLGNLGVAGVQVVALLVLATAGNRQPYWVCGFYLVVLAVVAISAALFMDNLDHTIELGHIRSVLAVPDTWVVTVLYSAAFGSWIGLVFAFSQVLHVNFVAAGQSPAEASLHTAQIAFVGPLLGSLSRLAGGRLADRIGGARVTLRAFVAMGGAAAVLVALGTHDDHLRGSGHAHGDAHTMTMIGYIVGFVALFILAGLANGSVFKMIPSVFEVRSRALPLADAERRRWASTHAGALIGFASAIGAIGGAGIDLTLRQSYAVTGSETVAYWLFLLAYGVAALITWQRYVRPGRPARPHDVAQPTEPAPALV
ncbi:MFS transporter [Mycolicibacillus koreensis]|nr:MFS transporter [Mycolicibacillus koreensis]